MKETYFASLAAGAILSLGIVRLAPASAPSTTGEQYRPFGKASMMPFVDFYSIGALRPHSDSGRLVTTDDILRQWREVEQKLLQISRQNGNVRAADAILLVACGQWLYENNPDGAILLIESVSEDHPLAPTILSVNPTDWICPLRLDLNWYIYLRDQVREETDGKSRMSARASWSMAERQQFVSHLQKHPSRASDVASLLTAVVARDRQDYALVETSLQSVLDRHSFEDMNRMKLLDEKAASRPHGVSLRGLYRPETAASVMLAIHYEARGDAAKACSLAEELADAVSDDGFHHGVNMWAGDVLRRAGTSRKAERQYRLALSGYLDELRQRIGDAGPSATRHLPVSAWRVKIESIKRAIRQSGGAARRDAQELEPLLDSQHEVDKEDLLDPNALGEAFEEMRSAQGEYVGAKKREARARHLVNMLKAMQAGEAKQEREDIQKLRRSMAVGLVAMAVADEDASVRNVALDLVPEVVRPHAGYRAGSLGDGEKEKVDDLLAQIKGEDAAAPVPHAGSNLADMDASALLYAARQLGDGDVSSGANRLILQALTNSENPALYGLLMGFVRDAENVEIRELAARGLARIIKNAGIDGKGVLVTVE